MIFLFLEIETLFQNAQTMIIICLDLPWSGCTESLFCPPLVLCSLVRSCFEANALNDELNREERQEKG